VTPQEIDHAISAARASTARLLALIAGWQTEDMRRPSTLPDWTVGHLLTHLARNAEGNCRMLDGAARDEIVDQYPHGREGRAADIEAGSDRPGPEIVADVTETAAALDERWSMMPREAWARPVRMFSGEQPAWGALVSRNREIEVHAVDLDCGYTPADWPAAFVAAELDHVVRGLEGRLAAGTALRAASTDTGWVAEVGAGPASVTVTGPAAYLLAWLIGRAVPEGTLLAPAGLPPLGAW